jgi:hypothetical protein
MTDINEQIIKELKKSGFPLEIFVSIKLNESGWVVRPTLDYFDPNIDDYREADIIAYKNLSAKKIFNILVIECKKSDSKPWVFIRQKRDGNLSENLNILCSPSNSAMYNSLESTMQFHHYSKTPICTYYIVPFTNGENSKLSKAIFHGKNQVISALNHLFEQRSEMYRGNTMISKTFFYPIIVFDGDLYSAKINEDNIALTKENHLILSVERELSKKREIRLGENTYRNQEYKPYFIDIVKKEYFEEYLKNFQQYYINSSDLLEKSFKI